VPPSGSFSERARQSISEWLKKLMESEPI
jgi:hypothetical protein